MFKSAHNQQYNLRSRWARSSARWSARLIICWSLVQIRSGPPFTFREEYTLSPKKRAPRNAKNRGRGVAYPMDIGEEFEVDIFDVTPTGEGVAKIKNFPVFIKNAKLHEHVKIRITNLVSGSADAELVT